MEQYICQEDEYTEHDIKEDRDSVDWDHANQLVETVKEQKQKAIMEEEDRRRIEEFTKKQEAERQRQQEDEARKI